MSRHVINNATLWIGDGTNFAGHLVIDQGRIEAVKRGSYDGHLPTTDLGGAPLSPGLIDLMVCGGFGHSILRDSPRDIAREYLKLGVTSLMFAIGTLPWKSMARIAENIRRAMASERLERAHILGLYAEGPFQQSERTGGSLSENALPPTPGNIERLLDEMGDVIGMINVSPSTAGDVQAIRVLRSAGKIVTMAHSDAPAEKVAQCVAAGTTVLGHIWNNNYALLGDSGVQQPTIEQVALTDDRVQFIHMICDGQHVHPVMMKLVLRCRGIESLCIVTDAIPLAGCPDGQFTWDDGRSFSKNIGVGRTDTGGLAGSGTLLPDAFRNFVKVTGLPPTQAIRAVTYNPAASLGLENAMGLLAPKRVADLVAWDASLCIRRVWRAGREIKNTSNFAEVTLPAGEAEVSVPVSSHYAIPALEKV